MPKEEEILRESLKIIEKIRSSECKNKDKYIYKKNNVTPIITGIKMTEII